MKYLPWIITLIFSPLWSESFFRLNNVKKVYPVVEVQTDKVDKRYKQYITDELAHTLKELDVNTSGHDPRALALVVSYTYVGETPALISELVIGEEVKRLDTDEKTYALTYHDREVFAIEDPKDTESIEEGLEESIDTLLTKFADQYKEDNRLRPGSKTQEKGDFAAIMGYETDYAVALAKAKKEDKELMLVLVTNYCPWCRKFEANILQKPEVDKAVKAKYIPLILNRDEKKFPEKFTSSFTPVIYFIDAKREESLHKVVGYNNREEFLELIK